MVRRDSRLQQQYYQQQQIMVATAAQIGALAAQSPA
jgi:hypothetical protein